jgi:hypothetical protein
MNGVITSVAITSLPGASANAGAAGTFVAQDINPGQTSPPTLSNAVLSAVPGCPPKPLFVGQPGAFDTVLIGVQGQSGHFEIPSGGNNVVGLDLVTSRLFNSGRFTVLVATSTGGTISAVTPLQLLIDFHIFVANGDLQNHDTDNSNIADLFGTFLEGNQGSPPMPTQVVNSHNNNDDIINGVKGPDGPVPTGHREVVWDGVPETLRNVGTFSATFFDRQDAGVAKGVRGGIVFQPVGGTGEEVNDALNGAIPDPTTVGPPTNPNAPLGGDFSNVNPKFAGNLLSFTQSAQFSTLGTVTTDITFNVAGSSTKGVVHGLGIVFTSVDRLNVSSVEYFDESNHSIAKVFAPARAEGPFPLPGPVAANSFPYSFVGYLDAGQRIARVRVTCGEIPLDQATDDVPNGPKDVVAFDDVYYSEPQP